MNAPVSSTLIKELRDRTGVGIGKCKEALEHCNGDIEAAIAHLRKAGIASAVKKEGRLAKEGTIVTAENDKCIILVEINAETDFVIQNDRFQQFIHSIASEIVETMPASLETFLEQIYSKDANLTIDQYRATLVQSIGENIQIKRLIITPKHPNATFGVYSHMGGKIVCLVEVEGSSTEEALVKDIAMHVAAAHPEYLSPDKVPAHIIETEEEIAKSRLKEGPDNLIDTIVKGKLNTFFDTTCLTRQKFIKNDKLNIEDVVAHRAKEVGKPLQLKNFIRWSVGQ